MTFIHSGVFQYIPRIGLFVFSHGIVLFLCYILPRKTPSTCRKAVKRYCNVSQEVCLWHCWMWTRVWPTSCSHASQAFICSVTPRPSTLSQHSYLKVVKSFRRRLVLPLVWLLSFSTLTNTGHEITNFPCCALKIIIMSPSKFHN